MTTPEKPTPVRVSASTCPACGAAVSPRYRPFCSRRCADVDLHRWLTGGYAIPTEEPALEDEDPSPNPE